MENKQQTTVTSQRMTIRRQKPPQRNKRAPTQGGQPISQVLLRKVPLFPQFKDLTGQLYYENTLGISASIGSIGIYWFSANGLYDPNSTGTGHQPLGFDQMMLLYEQYTVYRSHIKVNFLSSTSGNEARVALILAPDTTVPSLTATMENGLLKSDIVIWGTDGHHRMKTLELSCDIPKYFGREREAVIADPSLTGTVAANPIEQVYFGICVWSPFQAAATSVSFDVTLSFDTHYWEPKKLASS